MEEEEAITVRTSVEARKVNSNNIPADSSRINTETTTIIKEEHTAENQQVRGNIQSQALECQSVVWTQAISRLLVLKMPHQEGRKYIKLRTKNTCLMVPLKDAILERRTLLTATETMNHSFPPLTMSTRQTMAPI